MNFTKFGATALAVLMLTSVFAMGAMAATTTTESDWSDTETTEEEITDNVVADFNASGDQTTTVIVETEQTFDADALSDADVTLEDWDTLELEVAYEGTTHTETVAVDEADSDISLTDTTGEVPAEASFEIAHDELDTLPGDAGSSTIADVTVTEVFEDAGHADADEDDMVTVETEFVTEFQFANSYAVATLDDDSATIDEQDAGWASTLSFGVFGDDDPVDLHTLEQTVGVDGDNTTVTVNDDTTDGADAFDGAIGERDDGDLIYGAAAAVDGTPVLAFEGEADEDLVDENDTYAVHDNGAWTFNIGEDHADAEEVDVFVSSQSYTALDYSGDDLADLFMEQADMDFMDLGSAFGYTSLGAFNVMDLMPFMSFGSIGLAGLAFAGHRGRVAA